MEVVLAPSQCGALPVTTIGVRPSAPLRSRLSLIVNFAQRDLKARYKGTVLGWAWSLLVPLASLAVYSVVVRLIFRGDPPPMGTRPEGEFTTWLFAGLIVWGLFNNGINTSIVTLLGVGALMKKIYFPAYAPVIGAIVSVGFQALIEMSLLLVALLFFGNIGPTWLLFPAWLLLFSVFVASLSLILSIFNVWYRDLAHITQVGLQLFFYMTPIIYPIMTVPAVTAGIPLRAIINYSPLSQFIEVFRDIFYGLSPSSPLSWAYLVVWTGLVAGIAYWVSATRGRDLSEEL